MPNARPLAVLLALALAAGSTGCLMGFVHGARWRTAIVEVRGSPEDFSGPRSNFQDDWIWAAWDLRPHMIRARLRVRGSEPLALRWDQAAFRDIDGAWHRLVDWKVDAETLEKPLPPRSLRPGGKTERELYPADFFKVYANGSLSHYRKVLPLVQSEYGPKPAEEEAPAYVGRTVALRLPIERGEERRVYVFVIEITDYVIHRYLTA